MIELNLSGWFANAIINDTTNDIYILLLLNIYINRSIRERMRSFFWEREKTVLGPKNLILSKLLYTCGLFGYYNKIVYNKLYFVVFFFDSVKWRVVF